MKKLLANCCDADNCLRFKCEWYTPEKVKSSELRGWIICKHTKKMVYRKPYTPEDWDIFYEEWLKTDVHNPGCLDEEIVLEKEGIVEGI